MTEDPCRRWQPLLAAYAMHQLSPEERVDVQSHLETCDACTVALDEILPVARLLPLANLQRVENRPHTRPEVVGQLFAKISAEKARQRRVRYASSGVLSVAAVVVAALLIIPLIKPTSQPGHEIAFSQTPTNVVAEGRIVDESWGTEVHLDVEGLSGRQTVWFEQLDGTRASAGSFEAPAGARVELVLSTAFKAANAVALCISPPEKPPTLRAPLNL